MRVYKVVKLRTEGKYLVTVTITTADAAAKVIESAKAKAEYQEIYFNIAETPCATSNGYYPRRSYQ